MMGIPLGKMDFVSRADVVAMVDDEQDPAASAREIATQKVVTPSRFSAWA